MKKLIFSIFFFSFIIIIFNNTNIYAQAQVGELYYNYISATVPFDEEHTSSYYSYGEAGSKSRIICDGLAWADEYENYAPYTYVCYKVDNVIDAPYQSEAVGYLYNGCERTVTYSQVVCSTYETSLTNSLKTMASLKEELGIKVDICNAGISSTEEITASVSYTIRNSTTITNTESETLTYPIYEDGYYFAQRRATFHAFIVSSFEKEFEVITSKKWVGLNKNTYYEYKLIGYRLKEIRVFFQFIENYGLVLSLCKRLDDGTYIYNGPKDNSTYIYF